MRPRPHRRRSVHRAALGEREYEALMAVIRSLVQEAEAWAQMQNREIKKSERRPVIKNVIAPDGYIPNSIIRQDILVHRYKPFEAVKKDPDYFKSDVSSLAPGQICLEPLMSQSEGDADLAKDRREAMRTEASRFKLSVLYNESKKTIQMLDLAAENQRSDTSILRLKNRMARKAAIYRMRRKLLMLRMRRELLAYARLRILEENRRKTLGDQQVNRRLIKPSLTSLSRVSDGDFREMRDKLIANLKPEEDFNKLMEGALKDPVDEAAMQRLLTILGSDVQLNQFLTTFKQPRHLFPHVISALGGHAKAFRLIDRAMLGDFRAIYKIAGLFGYDFKMTVHLLRSIEKTVMAAVGCLITQPCHFHYVEDFVYLLLKKEWTKADLIELANGRYVQDLAPGEKPHRNPLLAVATRMTEKAFLEFYKAVRELNYHYLKSLDAFHYEQKPYKEKRADSDSPSPYAEILEAMEEEENRHILRPSKTTLRKLATQMLNITLRGGVPVYLAEYFAKMVSKQKVIVCSQLLLEVRNGRSEMETLSLNMNEFLKVFVDVFFNIKHITNNRYNETEIVEILLKVVKGDVDESYRLESILERNLARFLIGVLRYLYGKVVNGILFYAIVSSTSDDLEVLLQDSLELNEESPAKPLIESWITLTDLIFLLADELIVEENVTDVQNLLRKKRFFVEAGCKGVMKIPQPLAQANPNVRRMRSMYMPIKTRTSSVSLSIKSWRRPIVRKRRRSGAPRTPESSWKASVKDYRFMLSRATGGAGARGSGSEESTLDNFLDRESDVFSAQKTVLNLEMSESESESEASVFTTSIFDSFKHDKSTALEVASAIETATMQITKTKRDISLRKAVEPEQMELVEDSWSALVELQSMQRSAVPGDWLSRLTSWLGSLIGDHALEGVTKMDSLVYGEDAQEVAELTKKLWHELSSIKATGMIYSVEETYGRFRQYLKYLRSELLNEEHLGDTAVKALSYGLEDVAQQRTLTPSHRQTAKGRQNKLSENVQQKWTTTQSIIEGGLRETLAMLSPISSSSEESPHLTKKVSHVVPSLQTLVGRKEIMIVSSAPTERAPTTSIKSLPPLVPRKQERERRDTVDSSKMSTTSKELIVQGRSYHSQQVSRTSSISIPKKTLSSATLPLSTFSPMSSNQRRETERQKEEEEAQEEMYEKHAAKEKVELHIDGIVKNVFLPRRKSVGHRLYKQKRSELAKYLQMRHDYNKEASEELVNNLFKVGLKGVSHPRLSQLLTNFILTKPANEESADFDETSEAQHRDMVERVDDLVDWVELLNSVTEVSSTPQSTSSTSSVFTQKPAEDERSTGSSLQGKAKLPRMKSKRKTPEQSLKSRDAEPLPQIAMLPPTASTISRSDRSGHVISSGSSSAGDTVARTDSTSSLQRDSEPSPPRIPSLSKDVSSRERTSQDGASAFSTPVEIASSEYSDAVLTDENADLDRRRSHRRVSSTSSDEINSSELADHIADVLITIMDVGEDSKTVIRGMLNVIAENPQDLEFIEKPVIDDDKERSIFWNDNYEGMQIMDVFQDVVYGTASKMLMHLNPVKSSQLLSQVRRKTSQILGKLSKVGTIVLSANDARRLYDGMAVLNSSSLRGVALKKRKPPPPPKLPGNRRRWFTPLDLDSIFRSSPRVELSHDVAETVADLPENISRTSSEESAIIIADAVLPFLPPKIIEANQRLPKRKRFAPIILFELPPPPTAQPPPPPPHCGGRGTASHRPRGGQSGRSERPHPTQPPAQWGGRWRRENMRMQVLDARIQRRLRIAFRNPSKKNNRDITKLMNAVMQQSEHVRRVVNKRLNALGLAETAETQKPPVDMSNVIRVVNRPSFIRPHEWTRLIGKTGLASFRFGNSTLCHRGESGALGPLIRADAKEGLSHKMVTNYDLAHVFNRHSLFQLTELFGDA